MLPIISISRYRQPPSRYGPIFFSLLHPEQTTRHVILSVIVLFVAPLKISSLFAHNANNIVDRGPNMSLSSASHEWFCATPIRLNGFISRPFYEQQQDSNMRYARLEWTIMISITSFNNIFAHFFSHILFACLPIRDVFTHLRFNASTKKHHRDVTTTLRQLTRDISIAIAIIFDFCVILSIPYSNWLAIFH